MNKLKQKMYPLGALLPRVSILLDNIRMLFLTIPFIVLAASCGDHAGERAGEKLDDAADKIEARVDTMQQNMKENRDERFVKDAAEDNMEELQLLNLVASKAMSKDLRKAAMTMRKDHEKVASEVAEYAAAHNITIEADTMNSNDMADDKSGADWDKKALDELVNDHEGAVKNFEDASSKTDDAALRTWTVNTLPVLQKHLAMLKEMQGRMK